MERSIESVFHKLIVSCQALPEEPLHSSFIMGRMAVAAEDEEPEASEPIR